MTRAFKRPPSPDYGYAMFVVFTGVFIAAPFVVIWLGWMRLCWEAAKKVFE